MIEKTLAQVNFEIGQIDHLLESYATVFQRAQVVEPDLVETTAVASVLHSFYNGLENIFLSIAKGVDSVVPNTWSEMQGLAGSLDAVWNAAKSEVQAFLINSSSSGEQHQVE